MARSHLEKIEPYQVQLERKQMLRLDLNENSHGCSPRVFAALAGLEKEDLAYYPEYQDLVFDLALYAGVEPVNILLTNGGDEALRTCTETYLDPGDKLLLPVPTYSFFRLLGELRQAEIEEVSFNEDLSFPLATVIDKLAAKPRMLICANPQSPTGCSLSTSDIQKLLVAAGETVVLLDETYHHFGDSDCADMVEDSPNLVIIRSFSKAFGLAGLRLGYIISRKENIADMKKVNPPFPVSSPALKAGRAALAHTEFLNTTVRKIKEEKTYLQQNLHHLGILTHGTDTNFLLLRLGQAIYHRLKEAGILLRSLTGYPLLGDYLRLTVGTRRENDIFLSTLARLLPAPGIIFDMDGVLVDVSASYHQAIKETVKSFTGELPTAAEIRHLKLRGGYNDDWLLTETLIKNRGYSPSYQDVKDRFQSFYLDQDFNGFIRNETWLIPQRELQALKEKHRLGIVTGRPALEALHALKKAGMENCFTTVVTREHTPRVKPDPAGLLLALAKMGCEHAFYLGDTPDDMAAAQKAGLVPVGVIPPGVDKTGVADALKAAGARYVFASAGEFIVRRVNIAYRNRKTRNE